MGIDLNKPVDVYRNLTRNVWSIRQGGKVQCHAKRLVLKDCKFIVSEKGRQRVIRDKRKNVHAVIRGLLSSVDECNAKPIVGKPYAVRYNPYQMAAFQKDDGTPVLESAWCDLMIVDKTDPVIAWN